MVFSAFGINVPQVVAYPLFVYCMPVVGVFGDGHFVTHAALWPADGVGCCLVVIFYFVLAILTATTHWMFRKRK